MNSGQCSKYELHLLILPDGSFPLGFITFIVLFQFSSYFICDNQEVYYLIIFNFSLALCGADDGVL